MPKMKVSKSVAKRVKVTARGKVMRHRAGAGHLKSRKSPGRLRRLRKITTLSEGMVKHAKHRLGLM